uniref:Uncharacterized protein n=1 Tax=Mycolicibacterium sp. CBMA 213 TaxID=1968788 RepID=A0A343VRM2_9MYCO|nr:hypothetical protein B5P44_p00251 [Mycolicibacterium sp. CBMA 213]
MAKHRREHHAASAHPSGLTVGRAARSRSPWTAECALRNQPVTELQMHDSLHVCTDRADLRGIRSTPAFPGASMRELCPSPVVTAR